LPPSALVTCRDGDIVDLHMGPITRALASGLTPVVYGDVAFDEVRGGVIVSTEQVLAALVPRLQPERLTLVGLVDGIFDADPLREVSARRISHLTVDRIPELAAALGGSHGVDVTGGMVDKITNMALLLEQYPQLRIHLLSGELPGHLRRHLLNPDAHLGTTMTSS
jgi:isopentenyl phosphate kinase